MHTLRAGPVMHRRRGESTEIHPAGEITIVVATGRVRLRLPGRWIAPHLPTAGGNAAKPAALEPEPGEPRCRGGATGEEDASRRQARAPGGATAPRGATEEQRKRRLPTVVDLRPPEARRV